MSTRLKTVVILVGPPGSGKTSAGTELARQLSWSFADTDRLIEQQASLTVAEIFSEKGEERFRRLETGVLRALAGLKPARMVIATGGGILVTAGNFELMKQIGKVVCLSADPETLVARLSGDSSRPLLSQRQSKDESSPAVLKTKLSALLVERQQYYSLPDHQVKTDGLTPELVAHSVRHLLGLS